MSGRVAEFFPPISIYCDYFLRLVEENRADRDITRTGRLLGGLEGGSHRVFVVVVRNGLSHS